MSMRKHGIYIVFALTLSILTTNATHAIRNIPEYIPEFNADSLTRSLTKQDLDKIQDLRTQFKRLNQTYSKPEKVISDAPVDLLSLDELPMSEEALYWSRKRMSPADYIPRHYTFRDTILPDTRLLPSVFSKEYLRHDFSLDMPVEKKYERIVNRYEGYKTNPFDKQKLLIDIRKDTKKYLAINHPEYFRYSDDQLPKDIVTTEVIRKKPERSIPAIKTPEKKVDEIAPPVKFIPDRMYWTSKFESAVQFSQNYVSPNWHQGGSSNLNLFTRNYLQYNYKRDKVNFTNELESKISIYNASKDTLHRYKIGEDVFRIHSNFGYQAYNNWYYSFDGEFKTQLLRNYAENRDLRLASFLAPLSINLGVGMKYELNKPFEKKGKNLKFSTNLAPVSYTYMYSRYKDMDLGRHGFEKKEGSDEYKNWLSRFGSTLRADLTMSFNPNISWQSRFYYFTTYEKVIMEYENTLIFAVTRHLSTRVYLHLRFDDSVTKKEDFDSYFQVNQLLSFGFNYKW